MPLGELAWSAGFARWWPYFFTFLFDLDLETDASGKIRLIFGRQPEPGTSQGQPRPVKKQGGEGKGGSLLIPPA